MSELAFQELLYGSGAHANTLACVEDVPFILAGRRVADFSHSIWQLVWHMNFWMEYEWKRIHNELLPYPTHAVESWPDEAAPPSEQEWKKAIARFRELLGEFTKLAESPPDFLTQQVTATDPDHAKRSSSVLAVLWQTLVHNSYHIGQVAMLRRALGIWPPEGGTDTW